MIIFEPFGPCEIPVEKPASSRLIKEDLSGFWERYGNIASRVGCYVYAIKTGRAIVPFYVGMTTKTFQEECFTSHKLNHYHRAMGYYSRGKPVISFLVYPLHPGPVNKKAIIELENFLLQAGMAVNPALRNIRGCIEPCWGIKGIVRSGPGARSKDAHDFAKMMHVGRVANLP